MSLTAEQLELRRTGVGASEAAAACGFSKWQQTVELYLAKTGEVQQSEDEVNEDLLFGEYMEASGVRLWSRLRQRPVEHPLPTVRHPENPILIATGDASLSPTEGLEFKTMDFFRYRKLLAEGIESVAPEYLFQCQQQMLVLGWSKVTLAIMVGKKFHDYEVEANPRLQRIIIERTRVFWDHVERREPPDINFSMEGALRAVQALYPEVKNGAVVPLDDESNVMWEAYRAAGQQIKELEKKQEGYKAAVLSRIGENYAGLLTNGNTMIRRKVVKRKGYTVLPNEFVECREVKYDGSPLLALMSDSETEPAAEAAN
jgi:predicted phage-related endonuclease